MGYEKYALFAFSKFISEYNKGMFYDEAVATIQKLKSAGFAAKVDRNEIQAGIELLGVDQTEHIQFIIDVLKENKEELGI